MLLDNKVWDETKIFQKNPLRKCTPRPPFRRISTSMAMCPTPPGTCAPLLHCRMPWATCPVTYVLCHMAGPHALDPMSCVACPGPHVLLPMSWVAGSSGFVGLVGVRGGSGSWGPCGLGELARGLHEDAREWRGAPGSAFGSQWTTPASHPCAAGSPRCPAMCLGWRLVILVLRLLAPCLRGCICLAA